jgi:transcriptional regulator with XRE-family HTH domain
MAQSELGEMIKQLRQALGDITQERFGRRLGTSARTVARWEAAENLSPAVLSRLRSIASSISDYGLMDFFDEKLREDQGRWDMEPNFPEQEGIPGTADERDLVREFLRCYRNEDPAFQPMIEQLWNRIVENEEESRRQLKAIRIRQTAEQFKPKLRDRLLSRRLEPPRESAGAAGGSPEKPPEKPGQEEP